MQDKNDHKLVEKAVSLSLVEIGLGSLVHTFKIPIGGHVLSLNQGVFLIRSIQKIPSRFNAAKDTFEISMIVALLKSLSPAGRKFGPMISIGMQGILFSVGILSFGSNLLGHMVGISLLSIWAFFQPFISYFVIYGKDILVAFDYLISKINQIYPVNNSSFIYVLLLLIIIKIFVSILFALSVRYIPEKYWILYDQKLVNLNESNKLIRKESSSALKGAFLDLLNPFFIISFLLMGVFFFVSKENNVEFVWKILRVFAIAFIIFYLSRAQWFFNLMMKLTRKSNSVRRIFRLCEIAYQKLIKSK